jgi:hypothetical protein
MSAFVGIYFIYCSLTLQVQISHIRKTETKYSDTLNLWFLDRYYTVLAPGYKICQSPVKTGILCEGKSSQLNQNTQQSQTKVKKAQDYRGYVSWYTTRYALRHKTHINAQTTEWSPCSKQKETHTHTQNLQNTITRNVLPSLSSKDAWKHISHTTDIFL